MVRLDVPEPCSSFRRRIKASVDSRWLQINRSTGFENSSFQLGRPPQCVTEGGSRDREQNGKVGQTANATVGSVFDPRVDKRAAACGGSCL